MRGDLDNQLRSGTGRGVSTKRFRLWLVAFVFALATLATAQTHTFPATDTANVFTNTNQFTVGVLVGPTTVSSLSGLGAANGTIIYVTDGLIGSSPCTGGSTGAIAELINGTWVCGGGGGGGGGVSSVALSLPSGFSVSGSPITTSGTLTGAWSVFGPDQILISTAANTAGFAAALASCGDGTHATNYDATTHRFGCQALSTGTGGTVTNVSGTANQISVTSGTTTPVLSIANPFTFPGSVTNNLSIFGTTTSAQLAGVVSDETGTGVLVLNGGPTFTGTVGVASLTGTSAIDFSGATITKLRVGATLTTSANGDIGYDTTNKNWHVFQNGVDSFTFGGPVSGSYSNGDCVKFGVSGGVITLVDNGSICGIGGNTTSTSLTTNTLPKANGANSIINSLLTDSGTVLSYTGTGGAVVNSGGSVSIFGIADSSTNCPTVGLTTGNAYICSGSFVPLWITDIASVITTTQFDLASSNGVANGIATLDGTGNVPATQLLNFPAAVFGLTGNTSMSVTSTGVVFTLPDFGASPITTGVGVTDTSVTGTDNSTNFFCDTGTSSVHVACAMRIHGVNQIQVVEQPGPQGQILVGSAVVPTSIGNSPFTKMIVMSNTATHNVFSVYQNSTSQSATLVPLVSATAAGTGWTALSICSGATGSNAQCGSGLLGLQIFGDASSLYKTTSAASQYAAWKNTTAALVGASQSSPNLALCGTEWHSSASTEGCLNIQFVPGTGSDAANILNFTHTGSATGVTTSQFPGPVGSGSDGVHAAYLSLLGNTTAPAILANTVGFLGPNSASFTAYGLQLSSTAPSGTQVLSCGTPSSSVSACTWVTGGAGTVTSIATTGPIGGGTITTTGTITCTTCLVASSPGAGILHVAGGTQTATSSTVSLTADVSGVLPLANMSQLFVTNAQTATYQVLAADFAGCKTIPVASGTFTITLVASGTQPASGQCIDIINYGTGVVTVARSGQNLNGGVASLTLAAGSATAPTGGHVVSDGTNYEMALWGGAGGGGVTSFSGDGVIITNSASTGAVTTTIAGTSGAVPCFSSTSAWKSGALLATNALTVGGGTGNCPSTGSGDFTYATHTLTAGASGVLDLSAAAPTAGLKLPSVAGAVPTADGFLGVNTTNHTLVSGSNGNTIVQAAAATGTNLNTTCTNQVITVISGVAAPTCTTLTAAFIPNIPINQVISATGAIATFANGNNPLTINCALTSGTTCLTTGETTAASTVGAVEHQITTLTTTTAIALQITQGAAGPAAANAPAVLNISAAAAGGAASTSINGLTGAPISLLTGAGSAGGATTGNGGTGGAFTVTLGAGGAHGGTTTNTGGVGGAFSLTPGAGTQGSATGAGGAAGTFTLVAATGGAGGATSGTGGAGSDFLVTTGTGGAATSGSTTGRGGNAIFTLGSAGGTGTAGAPGQFEIVGGTVGAANTTPFLNITGTWNTSGVVDAAIFANIINTGSGALSKLIDLQIGSTSQFNVDKSGNITALGTASLGSSPPACSGASQFALCGTEGTGPTGASSVGDIWPNSADHNWYINSNAGVTQHFPQTLMIQGAAYTNATTGFTTVVGGSGPALGFTVAASTPYAGSCYLVYSASAITAGPKIQFTGPASPTAVNYSAAIQITATPTYADSAAASAFSTSQTAGTAVTASTLLAVRINFSIINGTTAGTLTLQAASQGVGTLTLEPGSFCQMQ